ncbi:tyrosine-type recombinase/integrase [Nibricoccus sp. IMCC34717]|uniref:tyrosine-type recombinase/integrase n=1 Tax=Nibricoccus sp. IMCC34717 TaxID=3034021 RepID=UPI0038513C74
MRKDFALTPDQKMDARTAVRILEGSGITLTQAAEQAVRGRRALLRWTFDKACDEFNLEKARSGIRSRTVDFYQQKLSRLQTQLGERIMDEITKRDLDAVIKSLGKTRGTRASLVRAARALWNWCVKHDPQVAVEDVTSGMDGVGPSAKGDAQILTPAEVERIMQAAGPYTSALALMLFAGVRPEEVAGQGKQPLCWRHVRVSEKLIRVPAEIAKTGKPRLLEDLPPKVWRYLKAGKDEERISPALTRQAIKYAKRALGRKWPHDATRHTFATYALALTAEPGRVSMWLGHEGKPSLLHQRYRGLATKAEAEAYWR